MVHGTTYPTSAFFLPGLDTEVLVRCCEENGNRDCFRRVDLEVPILSSSIRVRGWCQLTFNLVRAKDLVVIPSHFSLFLFFDWARSFEQNNNGKQQHRRRRD